METTHILALSSCHSEFPKSDYILLLESNGDDPVSADDLDNAISSVCTGTSCQCDQPCLAHCDGTGVSVAILSKLDTAR